MTDIAWIDVTLASARPKALGALLRYFRDLDIAEEAFQEACLRAIRTWPDKGPPRDPTAWLIFVGRNSGIDAVRKQKKTQALPDELRAELEAEYKRRLREAYPSGPHGTALPFRRVFVVAQVPTEVAR